MIDCLIDCLKINGSALFCSVLFFPVKENGDGDEDKDGLGRDIKGKKGKKEREERKERKGIRKKKPKEIRGRKKERKKERKKGNKGKKGYKGSDNLIFILLNQ